MRLELDASKARLRNIRGVRPADLQNEVETLEKEFAAACEEAIQEMKTFIQYVRERGEERGPKEASYLTDDLTFYRRKPRTALKLLSRLNCPITARQVKFWQL